MKVDAYLEFLRASHRPLDHQQAQLRGKRRMLALQRGMQLGGGDPSEALKYFTEHEMLRDRFGDDVSDQLEAYLKELLLPPLLRGLPEAPRKILANLNIAVLPLRTVSATALLAPEGEPVVLVNSGFLSMVHFFAHARGELRAAWRAMGPQLAALMNDAHYKFIIAYFKDPSMDFPPVAPVAMDEETLVMTMMMTMAMEQFALCHELAHIYLGHLARAETSIRKESDGSLRSTQAPRELSLELEADRLAWGWYQVACSEPGAFEFPIPPTSGLQLFELLVLVERNGVALDAYHPPPMIRLTRLAEQVLSDPALGPLAKGILESANSMPVFPPGHSSMNDLMRLMADRMGETK